MIKLSRAGWNNVIIFSVMGFILLIHSVYENKDFEQLKASDAQILSAHDVILSLTVNQQTNIERIGKTWRALPPVIQGQPLEAMMHAWHQLDGELIDKPSDLNKQNMLVVSMVLAGEEQEQYFLLFPETDRLVLFKQASQQYFQLAKPIFSQIVPNEVIL